MASSAQPLTRLNLETAILGNTTNLITLVGYVIKKSREVNRFREDCGKLANLCVGLSLSFTEKEAVLEDLQSAKQYFKCLGDIIQLFEQCSKTWSIRHLGWEVVVEGRLEKLKNDLDLCQRTFNNEIMMSLKSSESRNAQALADLDTRLDHVHTSIDNDVNARNDFLNSVRSLGQELEQSKREFRSVKASSTPQYPTVPWTDRRLRVSQIAGSLPLGTFNDHKVILKKVQADVGHAPRLLRIYGRICEVSRVQRLFGVTHDENGNTYGIMEDFSGYNTLAAHLVKVDRASVPLADRLNFAYEVAATLSSLHGNDIIVKNISDASIYVKEGSTYQPMLCEIENARALFEPSARVSYDLRYEAPEVPLAKMHSKASDVWSLGMVLIQWLTGILPAVSSQEISATCIDTRNQLKATRVLLSPISMIERCLSMDSFKRPTAAVLAQCLLDAITINATQNILGPNHTSISSDSDLEDVIRKAKGGIIERKKIRKAMKKKIEMTGPKDWITADEFQQLIKFESEERPYVSYIIGACILWGVVLSDQTSLTGPEAENLTDHIAQAKQAIPRLQTAFDLGFSMASEDLYVAHRTLGEFYQRVAEH